MQTFYLNGYFSRIDCPFFSKSIGMKNPKKSSLYRLNRKKTNGRTERRTDRRRKPGHDISFADSQPVEPTTTKSRIISAFAN